MNRVLMSKNGPALAGTIIGVIAALLVKFGNPGNMGVCVACFTRDVAGALGLHRAGVVQYLRPELAGFILGSFGSALLYREYRPRGGSSPMIRFGLGFFAMIGALVFLGCPWRAYLRLAGGDLTAVAGIAGLTTGIAIGIMFLYRGFSLGAARQNPKAAGYFMPLLAIALLALLVIKPLFGAEGTGPIFFSEKGPGSMHAPLIISLAAGLLVGWLAQRSRFCTVGAIRDLIMLKDTHLFKGIFAFISICSSRTSHSTSRGISYKPCFGTIQTQYGGAAYRAHDAPVEFPWNGPFRTCLYLGRRLPGTHVHNVGRG